MNQSQYKKVDLPTMIKTYQDVVWDPRFNQPTEPTKPAKDQPKESGQTAIYHRPPPWPARVATSGNELLCWDGFPCSLELDTSSSERKHSIKVVWVYDRCMTNNH